MERILQKLYARQGNFVLFLIIGIACILILAGVSFFVSTRRQTPTPTPSPNSLPHTSERSPGILASQRPTPSTSIKPSKLPSQSPTASASASPISFANLQTANYQNANVVLKYPTSWKSYASTNTPVLDTSAFFYQSGPDGKNNDGPRFMVRQLGSNETYDGDITENLNKGYQEITCQLQSVTCRQVHKLIPYNGQQFESDMIIAKTSSNLYMITFGYLLDTSAKQNAVIIQGMLANLHLT